MTEAAVWLVLLVALVLGNSVALWRRGAARYRPPSFVLTTAAVLVQLAAGVLIVVGAWWAHQRFALAWYQPVLAAGVGCALVWLVLLLGVLRFSLTETLRAAFTFGLTSACVLGFALIPLMVIYRTYRIPSNAMAPTLCGPHNVGRCSTCGARAVVPVREDTPGGTCLVGESSICSKCFRIGKADHVGQEPIPGDRILVRRLAVPRRWDLVVFLFPGDRSQVYVKRLVGFPGESVEVKDGGVWINGVRQEPPPELAGLRWFLDEEFLDEEAGLTPEFAAAGIPTLLKKNQYFVLGDFSPRSNDSRFWGSVPADDLRGVVSAVYWPRRSARILPQH